MSAERKNAPKPERYANQAGNARNHSSSANFSLPWRRGRFSASTMFVGFVLNEIWEMVQMFAYGEMTGRTRKRTLGSSTWAATGDLGSIFGIHLVGALAAGDLGWGLTRPVDRYAFTVVLRLALAALADHVAKTAWILGVHGAYARGVRAWRGPLAITSNETVTSPLTFLFTRWWVGGSARKETLR